MDRSRPRHTGAVSTGTAPTARSLRTHRGAAAGAFAVQGLLFIALTLRLPQVRDRLGLDELGLAALMLLLLVLAGVGSALAAVVARRRDSATAVRAALVLLAVGTALVGVATQGSGSLPVLVAAVAVYGLGVGANDAASNMQAVAVEDRMGRPVLPSFHAAWTAGGLLATLAVLGLGGLDHPVAHAVLTALPLALVAAPFLPRDHGAGAGASTDPGVPWRTIALVGLGLVLFYAVDTAVTAWGPVYLSSGDVFATPPTSPDLYALATLPYLVATLLARSLGDVATARLGAPTVVRVGAVTASAGLLVVVLAPASTWVVAVVGFFVVGLGVAVVAPLAFSAAARVVGGGTDDVARRRRVDATVARFNQFNYAGALVGSVLTGAVGTGSLRVGFALPMVLVLGLVPLARHFGGRPTDV